MLKAESGESVGDVPENEGGVIFVFDGLKQSDLSSFVHHHY
jgi:hypothetical protein